MIEVTASAPGSFVGFVGRGFVSGGMATGAACGGTAGMCGVSRPAEERRGDGNAGVRGDVDPGERAVCPDPRVSGPPTHALVEAKAFALPALGGVSSSSSGLQPLKETSPSLVYGAALLMRLGPNGPSRVRIPESPLSGQCVYTGLELRP